MQNAARLAVCLVVALRGINTAKDFMLATSGLGRLCAGCLSFQLRRVDMLHGKARQNGTGGIMQAVLAPPAPVLNEAVKGCFCG